MMKRLGSWAMYRVFLHNAGIAHDAVQQSSPEAAVEGMLSDEERNRHLFWQRVRDANHYQLAINTACWLRDYKPSDKAQAYRFAKLQSTGLSLDHPILKDPEGHNFSVKDVPFWLLKNYTFVQHPSRYSDYEISLLHSRANAAANYRSADDVAWSEIEDGRAAAN